MASYTFSVVMVLLFFTMIWTMHFVLVGDSYSYSIIMKRLRKNIFNATQYDNCVIVVLRPYFTIIMIAYPTIPTCTKCILKKKTVKRVIVLGRNDQLLCISKDFKLISRLFLCIHNGLSDQMTNLQMPNWKYAKRHIKLKHTSLWLTYPYWKIIAIGSIWLNIKNIH